MEPILPAEIEAQKNTVKIKINYRKLIRKLKCQKFQKVL